MNDFESVRVAHDDLLQKLERAERALWDIRRVSRRQNVPKIIHNILEKYYAHGCEPGLHKRPVAP